MFWRFIHWVVQETYEKRPNDCILLVKHLVNSESLSQPPLVLLPADFQKYIQHPVEALPLNLIADRARKEYRSPIMSNCYDFLDVSVSGVNILVGWPWSLHPMQSRGHFSSSIGLRFRRTAEIVEKEPWCLHRAASALRAWVETWNNMDPK